MEGDDIIFLLIRLCNRMLIRIFRLLQYDPKTKKSTVLMKNLHFANGVQLSNDESFVLVSETAKSRVLRLDFVIG